MGSEKKKGEREVEGVIGDKRCEVEKAGTGLEKVHTYTQPSQSSVSYQLLLSPARGTEQQESCECSTPSAYSHGHLKEVGRGGEGRGGEGRGGRWIQEGNRGEAKGKGRKEKGMRKEGREKEGLRQRRGKRKKSQKCKIKGVGKRRGRGDEEKTIG